MLIGLRMIVRDKTAFRMEGGVLRQVGKPMDMMNSMPDDVKLLHIIDLNAKDGNTTNFDLYNHMTYRLNIEVETPDREEVVKKLLGVKARAVLELPSNLDFGKFAEQKRLLVGKTDGRGLEEGVFDYYIETDDLAAVKKLVKSKKRVLVYSNTISEKEAADAGAFALIRDC